MGWREEDEMAKDLFPSVVRNTKPGAVFSCAPPWQAVEAAQLSVVSRAGWLVLDVVSSPEL